MGNYFDNKKYTVDDSPNMGNVCEHSTGFYNCCNVVVDDRIINDGRNYLIVENLNYNTIVPHEISLFNFGWLLIQYRNPNNPRLVWKRPVFCDITRGGDGHYYVTGVSPYSLNSNSSISIRINTSADKWVIDSINQIGNTELYPTEYVYLVGVGVL